MSAFDSGNDSPTGSQPTGGGGALAPDLAKCRARLIHVGLPSAWCLVRAPDKCRYSVPFAGKYICCHPQRARIVARTLAEGSRGSS